MHAAVLRSVLRFRVIACWVVACLTATTAMAAPADDVAQSLGQISVSTIYVADYLAATAELLRIREAAGEIGAADRQRGLQAAVAQVRSPAGQASLTAARRDRYAAALRLIALAESRIASARWPTDQPAAVYQERARKTMQNARISLAYLSGLDVSLVEAVKPAAEVLAWTQGRLNGGTIFDSVDIDIEAMTKGVFANLPRSADAAVRPTPPQAAAQRPPTGATPPAGTTTAAGFGPREVNTVYQVVTTLRDFAMTNAFPDQCRDACAADAECQAYTYVNPGAFKAGDPPYCYLLASSGERVANACCISGVKSGSAAQPGATPVASASLPPAIANSTTAAGGGTRESGNPSLPQAGTYTPPSPGSSSSPTPSGSAVLGQWFRGDRSAAIYEQAGQVYCRNERGEVSRCRVESATQVRALDWQGGLVGTVSADGRVLHWANNSEWTRQPAAAPTSAPASGGAVRNLALGRPAQMSSDYGLGPPAGGVDGKIQGSFGFHTKEEPNPWFQVDLGGAFTLTEARIYNRLDCCSERARTLRVLLSSDGANWRLAYAHNGTIFGGQDGRPLVVNLQGTSARYVRLQLAETNYLHLDEVEIYGVSSPAAGATTTAAPVASSAFLGQWYLGAAPAAIYEQAGQTYCRNERGEVSRCRVESPTQIRALDWQNGLVAVLTPDGRALRWANTSVWTRQPAAAATSSATDNVVNISGLWYAQGYAWTYQIAQQGNAFTWQRNPAESATGSISGNRVSANWGSGSGSGYITDRDSTGYVRQINWDNGVVFVRNPASPVPASGGPVRNLARDRPAQFSSDYGLGPPAGGVDGQINGGFGFHTKEEANAWFQVDLGAVFALTEARIYNRLDCCSERARTLGILLSSDGASWQVAYAHNGSVFGGKDGHPLVVNLQGRSARYVRLQLAEKNYLHLDEVEIYGR